MENYASHAERVEPMIHFLIELYRKWEKDSETGGTKSKINCPFLKWLLLHICAPPYLHGEAMTPI